VRLSQETIHQGGLAMVNMGDYGNIAKVFSFFQHDLPLIGFWCSHRAFNQIAPLIFHTKTPE
jgi:hypothetical protein